MTVSDPIESGNPNFLADPLDQLRRLVQDSARVGRPIREFETQLIRTLLSIGHDCVTAYLRLQGDGDLGSRIDTPDGRMTRSHDPRPRELRTLFGEHVYLCPSALWSHFCRIRTG